MIQRISLSTLFSVVLLLNYTLTSAQEIIPYEMFSNHFDHVKYTQQYNRSFDTDKIILQNNEYHPLTIAIYGILNYEEFVKSGDTTCYQNVMHQMKYFRDTSRLHFKYDGKGVGLPYHFKFHDLKPPWYSGMTQGVAISFLLRYYKLTNDKYAIKLVEKLAYLMIKPDKEGGAISKTPEGRLWIEEYPNSRKSVNVLNGFINGLVGLKEYCDFFPRDTTAKRIHDEVYESMVLTFSEYDRSDWSSYDRSGRKISDAYLRYELAQLDHLYRIYKDVRLQKQMMIWSMMMNDRKDTELKFYKNPNYIFSYQLVEQTGKTNTYSCEIDEEKVTHCFKTERISRKSSGKLASSRNFSTIEKFDLQIVFISEQVKVIIGMNRSIDLNCYEVLASLRGKSISQPKISCESAELIIESDELFDEVVIKRKHPKNKRLKIKHVRYYDYKTFVVPLFAHRNFEQAHKLDEGKKYVLQVNSRNAYDPVLFYKFSTNQTNLKHAKWHISQSIDDFNKIFMPNKSGYYEFFISYRVYDPVSMVSELGILSL